MVITTQDTKLNPGYKQTEVGVIPEDWKAKTFGEVMTGFASGATPSRKRPDFFKGNIRWITSGELNYNVIMDTIEKISVEAASKTNLKLLPKGTFLIAITGLEAEGTRGSCGIVGAEATTNQSCMALFPTKELSTHYLFHYYVYRGKSLALQYCQGTKQQSYTGKIVKLLPILLPPPSEQRVIATALSNVDTLITSLDKLIAKKRDIKQATMQQLLTGKKHLLGFSGEWEMKTFGEVMTGFASGATPSRKRPDFFKGDIRWITSGELNYNVIIDTIEKISVEAASKTNLKLLPKGTFLMAITGLEAEGTRGSCGIVGAEATTNQSCMALFPTKELSTHYLFHYYVYKGKSLALQYCQGTKQQSYTGKIVKLLPILLPPFDEQEAIATVLSDMDAEIAALEQKRDKTRALKQGMMQELLTGKTRLL